MSWGCHPLNGDSSAPQAGDTGAAAPSHHSSKLWGPPGAPNPLEMLCRDGSWAGKGTRQLLHPPCPSGMGPHCPPSPQDYRLGIGITYIEMNLGNVKEVDRRGFDLTTPYRTFSFAADSEQEKEEWVEAMQQSIAEALSNSEVAERIWALESNRSCADCGSPKPDWASINLCVVICKRCAGTCIPRRAGWALHPLLRVLRTTLGWLLHPKPAPQWLCLAGRGAPGLGSFNQ